MMISWTIPGSVGGPSSKGIYLDCPELNWKFGWPSPGFRWMDGLPNLEIIWTDRLTSLGGGGSFSSLLKLGLLII